jgi:hypothetical protein
VVLKVWRSHTFQVGRRERTLEVEMTLAVVEAGPSRSEALDLDQLQLEQFKHDEAYHREIARLTTQDRLKHMALHFAKYAGSLAENSDEAAMRKAVTDTFVIALSTANILNVQLSNALEGGQISDKDDLSFGRLLTIYAGQFAYLLTEEVVKIPSSAMGLISLKFGVKGPGLINVSGFHVDPGYWGRLVFSVYNAGPSEARLQRHAPRHGGVRMIAARRRRCARC